MSTSVSKPITPYDISIQNLKRMTYTLQKHLKYFKDSYILLQDDMRYLDMWIYEKGMLGLVNFMTVSPPDIKSIIKLEQLDLVDLSNGGKKNCGNYWKNMNNMNNLMLKDSQIDSVIKTKKNGKINMIRNFNNNNNNNNVNDIEIQTKNWNHHNKILKNQPKTIKTTVNQCKIQQQHLNQQNFNNNESQNIKHQYNNQQYSQNHQHQYEYSHHIQQQQQQQQYQYQNYSNIHPSRDYLKQQQQQQNSNNHREYKRGPYKNYTTQQKQRAVRLLIQDKLSVIQISRKLNIPCKNIKRWSQQGVQRKKGGGRKKFSPETERSVAQYFRKKYKENDQVMYEQVQAKAREMSKDQNFKASRGWVVKFVDRQNLRNYFRFI